MRFILHNLIVDADMPERAIEWYAKRANLGGWYEEVYYSLLQIALLKLN